MTMKNLLSAAVGLALFAMGPATFAQEEPEAADEVSAEETGSDQIEQLVQAVSAQKERIDTLEQRDAESRKKVEELEEQLTEVKEEQETAQLDAMGAGEDFSNEKKLEVYGFFDTTFVKNFLEKDSPYTLYVPKNSSFFMSSVNLYFKSQMTPTLSALVETRLLFLPHGWEESYPTVVVMNNADGTQTTMLTEGEYQRTDTGVRDQASMSWHRYGGIGIERAHLTYKPFDWLGFKVGRYLTPYGIWNIDHGTPVLIPIRTPYLQTRESVPLAQMGAQIFGRFYPGPDLFFDYAVTLSNGRGPIDTIMDLDENKGLGLRLKLSYEGKNFTIAAGAYGYWGDYTDSEKHLYVQVNPSLEIDASADLPVQSRIMTTESYREMALASDLLIEFFGVRLQGEYIRRRVDYDNVTPLESIDVLFSGGNLTETLYTASFIGNSFYGLIAYTLPLDKWISPVKITPFFMYENVEDNDTLNRSALQAISGGLNIKPSPFVALKVEYGQVFTKSNLFGTPGKQVAAQVAVSF